MQSNITSNQDRPALEELVDFLFIPTSFLRFAHTLKREGKFELKTEYKDSKFWQTYSKIYPYLSACFLEGFRLYGYYKLIE